MKVLELWLAIIGSACLLFSALIVLGAALDSLKSWVTRKAYAEMQVQRWRREMLRAERQGRVMR